jgi:hypothetical protein
MNMVFVCPVAYSDLFQWQRKEYKMTVLYTKYIINITIDAESGITEKELDNLTERMLYLAEKPDRQGFVTAERSIDSDDDELPF